MEPALYPRCVQSPHQHCGFFFSQNIHSSLRAWSCVHVSSWQYRNLVYILLELTTRKGMCWGLVSQNILCLFQKQIWYFFPISCWRVCLAGKLLCCSLRAAHSFFTSGADLWFLPLTERTLEGISQSLALIITLRWPAGVRSQTSPCISNVSTSKSGSECQSSSPRPVTPALNLFVSSQAFLSQSRHRRIY